MRHTNIFAFTPNDPAYPPYISINRQKDGAVTVTVRSVKQENGDCGDCAIIELPPEQYDHMRAELSANPVAVISINGHRFCWYRDAISYEEVCALAGWAPGATVVYTGGAGEKERGAPYAGQSIQVKDGTQIDCCYTGNA